MSEVHSFHLIHNSFTTILLDAIQFFPENLKSKHAESHGILFGLNEGNQLECDYVFPVGNVKRRTEDEIESHPKIDEAIQNAKQMLSTSQFVGTYHSHPHDEYFENWADPSNADVNYAKYLKEPYTIIVALTRDAKKDQELQIEYRYSDGYRFQYDKESDGHDLPPSISLNTKVQSIYGSFRKYTFEMRAYHFDGKYLNDISLFSSEAEVLMVLGDEKIKLDELDSSAAYRLRKMEYHFRKTSASNKKSNGRSNDNVKYHLERLKSGRRPR